VSTDPIRETTGRDAWEAAYCKAFRAEARERGWTAENIESGWLDEWPREAWLAAGSRGVSAAECGAHDVQVAETEAANA
jgi:hypothetical protein